MEEVKEQLQARMVAAIRRRRRRGQGLRRRQRRTRRGPGPKRGRRKRRKRRREADLPGALLPQAALAPTRTELLWKLSSKMDVDII